MSLDGFGIERHQTYRNIGKEVLCGEQRLRLEAE